MLSKLVSRFSFRSLLVGATLGTLALWALAGGLIAWRATERTSRDLTEAVVRQTSHATQAEIADLLKSSATLGVYLRAVFPPASVSPARFQEVFQRMLPVFEMQPQLEYLGLGLEETGEYAMLRRRFGRVYLREYVDQPPGNRVILDFVATNGVLVLEQTLPWDGYDPRKRPFHKEAASAGRDVWTDTYEFWDDRTGHQAFGLSYAIPVFREGRLHSVWDMDHTIGGLSSFLANLERRLSGLACVVELRKDGSRRVVAHPRLHSLTGAGKKGAEFNLESYPDPQVRALFAAAEAVGTRQKPGSHPPVLKFNADGEPCFGGVFQLSGETRPRWQVGVVVPQSEVDGDLSVHRWAATAVFLALLLFSSLFFLFLSKVISRPVLGLQREAEILASGLGGRVSFIQGPREIAALAQAFNEMAERIADRQTRLTEANQALQTSQAQMRSVFDNLPARVWVVDSKGVFTFQNSSSAGAHGRLTGADLESSTLPALTAGAVRSAIRKALGGSPVQATLLETLDGAEVWTFRSVSPVRVGGSVVGAVGVEMDMTDQRTVETALRENEAKYREIFENTGDCIFLIALLPQARFRIEEVNLSAEVRYSLERSEARGRSLEEVMPRDLAFFFRGRLIECAESGLPVVVGHEVEMASGMGTRWFETAFLPIRRDQGGIDRVVVVGRDLTEKKRGEETARLAEQRTRRANSALIRLARSETFHSTDLGAMLKELTAAAAEGLDVPRASVWLFSEDQSILECANLFEADANRHSSGGALLASEHGPYFEALATQRLLNCPDVRTDPRTATFSEGPPGYSGVVSLLDCSIRAGGLLRGVICLEETRERRRWTSEDEVLSGALATLAGQALESLDRHRSEQELRRSEEAVLALNADLERRVILRTAQLGALNRDLETANLKLQEVDRLKSEFLATMSHELRTPLNSIIGFTGIIKNGLVGPVNPEQAKQLGMVYGSARHLLGLINDLLDLSRIESGRFDLHPSRFKLQECLEEVQSVLSPLVAQKGLVFSVQNPFPGLEIHSDRVRVYQVLLNLCNNAVKFTASGGVRVVCRVEAGRVEMDVIDTGTGILPENLGKLFEAFRQVDGSARRVYEGAGLGLFLCRKLLRLLGGEISVKSEFGKGSIFTFWLPLETGPTVT